MGEAISHPSHYQGKIEVIEFLEDHFMDRPHEWNAVKYLARSNRKGAEEQDLRKAIWYIERKLELLKGEPRRPNEMNERKS
jgi:hypothetical protein